MRTLDQRPRYGAHSPVRLKSRLRCPNMRSRELEKVVLHRCPVTILRGEWHGCYAVQKALEEQGIDHEVRKAPLRKGSRSEVLEASGQPVVPTVEFADGS